VQKPTVAEFHTDIKPVHLAPVLSRTIELEIVLVACLLDGQGR
jgi:hypothetical protein